MAKVQKETVFLVSSAGSAVHYANRKNKKKFKGESKLKLKKYDPRIRKHVVFEEKKLSKMKKKFKVEEALASAAAASAATRKEAPKKEGAKKEAAPRKEKKEAKAAAPAQA